MRQVKAKNTTPELALRKLIWGMGYRGYRIHYDKLPGKPDIVFTKSKRVIFVHGCFWHGHDCRAGRNVPKSNKAYWVPKLERNKKRDKGNVRKIEKEGWKALIIWECELNDEGRVARRIKRFCV